jgi:hypothetical protein
MKTRRKQLYHGPALTQIVEHHSFKALNKAPDNKRGHYMINRDTYILVKYATSSFPPWMFTFHEEHMCTIGRDLQLSNSRTFVCLVCGDKTVCLLDENRIGNLLYLSRPGTQRITVEAPEGCSMRVSGSKGEQWVSRSSFPDKIFEIRL